MAKHFIYHIFNKKIGCTNNVKVRMRTQHIKEGEYEILEEHTNAKVASIREMELQKQYGYRVDNVPYWKTIKNQKKSSTPQARKKARANTDYKAIVEKTDYKAWVAAMDYKIREAKIDRKKVAAKIDWKKKVANTDYELRNNNQNFKDSRLKIIKPINQYSLEGTFIKRWNSITEAAEAVNGNTTNIGTCCKGRQATSYGYKWEYAK